MSDAAVVRLLKELRRRRVFRVAGLYVVGVWLLMQAANILLPAWVISETAIRNLLWAALLGFPVALVFGWIFQVTPEGIRRTRPEWSAAELEGAVPLRRADYLVLSAFVVVLGLIGYDAIGRMARTGSGSLPELRASFREITPNSVAVLPFASLSSWRGYYAILRDPRWDAVREEPRYRAILARVEADIRAQRARMAQIEAEDDFAARLDAVAAAREADSPSAGGTLQNR